MTPASAFFMARQNNERCRDAEAIIVQDDKVAYYYACYYDIRDWEEFGANFKTPHWAYYYIVNVHEKRFAAFEERIHETAALEKLVWYMEFFT